MTFKELTYSVWEILSGYNITDDNELTLTIIEENMLSMNQTLLREAYNNKRITQSMYVMDNFVEVEKMDHRIYAEGVTIKADGRFCVARMHELVAGVGNMDLNYFGSTDLSNNYSRKSFRNLANGSGGTLWTLHKPSYGIVQNVAYIEAQKLLGAKYVTAIGLWNDPREASEYDDNADFPTPSEYRLQLLTIQHLFTGKNVPPDLISDAQRQVALPARNPQRSRAKKSEVEETE